MTGVMPDVRTCERARLSRDARFDGLFFTAVTSTRIYCRPVCPAPTPRPRNVTYFQNAAAAEEAGYRPCLRCRPELAAGDPARRRGDDVVARALALIDEGQPVDEPLGALARRVDLGERQLRRLFVERLGAPPVGVRGTRRLLLAKQLLTDTSLPVTAVAMAAGFGSVRRFNTVFREAYRMAPRDIRRRSAVVGNDAIVLRLGYRPPYDFDAMLQFLGARTLPGVDVVSHGAYARIIGTPTAPGWLRVSRWLDEAPGHGRALRLELHGCAPSDLLPLVTRVRRMFDLDADPAAVEGALALDPQIASLVRARPGLRLPGGWDGTELAVRAVIGQQVSVAAARTVATRLAQRFGTRADTIAAPEGLSLRFPDAAALVEADLTGLGLTRDRAHAIRTLARALVEGHVGFDRADTLDAFVSKWTRLPGIGPWTAHYLALRALSHPDAFPEADLILRTAASGDGSRLSATALRARADAWRPWRAYAAVYLWNTSAPTPALRRRT